MMNILIDLSQIPLQKVGVGVYALNTFSRILKYDRINNYFLLIQDDDKDCLCWKYNNTTIIVIPSKIFRRFPFRILMEQIYIPYLIKKYKIDAIHSLHYSFPLISFGAKRIITVHDLTFFLFPKLHTKVKRYYFRWFTRKAVQKHNTIICVSQSTNNDLKRIIPNINSKIVTIPLASKEITVDEIDINNVVKKFNLPTRYISFIGTLEPRKNIENLLRAFSKLTNKDLWLVLVGKKGWYYNSIFELIEKLNLQHRVIITGFVSDKEKYAILKNSEIFIYPSLYEGFGLPVLEALKAGVPTITSNISSMPEVAGDAALLIDPVKLDDLTAKLELLTENDALKISLSSKGLLQAAQYTWDKTAKMTIDVYNSIASVSIDK